jgi:hypothetical protein
MESTKFFDLEDKYFKKIKELYPKTPDYVIEEFIDNSIMKVPSAVKRIENTYFGDIAPELRGYADWFLSGPWILKVLEIGWDDFDATTQQAFLERDWGNLNSYLVPRDKERLEYQKKIAKGDGSNEPIILIKEKDKYILIEGWHRTMSILTLGDNGDHPDTWDKQKINAYIHL